MCTILKGYKYLFLKIERLNKRQKDGYMYKCELKTGYIYLNITVKSFNIIFSMFVTNLD
jgi:hypothetical protein